MTRLKRICWPVLILCSLTVHAQTDHLTKKDKAAIVAGVAASLQENYIYLDTAIRMGVYIQRQLGSGAYDSIDAPSAFASRLTADILSVYHDGHLSVRYDPAMMSADNKPDTGVEKNRMLAFRKRVNFGFDKAEILPGNIGYLKIDGFFQPDQAARAMTQAALRFVSNSTALIIDLRHNGGGDPSMVSYVCGFLFDHKTHLNDLYSRKDKHTDEFWAIPDTTLTALDTLPIYILTSHYTYSAGEELSYDLQSQKRAVIIGEVTGGGAHPFATIAIAHGIFVNIPFARAINPITKANWEGGGVKPDVRTPADQALETALTIIKNK
jgi:retinol-binding protein 3